ncbi:MAG: hotdog fold thioesterase [Deltaproteobacteria bacterium]|nr:hotdog fold thioesterase [Deltaproteobacteria bacterium]
MAAKGDVGGWDPELVRSLMEEHVPFNKHLGLKALQVTPEEVHLCLPYRAEFVGDPIRGALHGGTVSALIDTAGGAVAFLNVSANERVSTVDLVVDYLRPGPLADIVAKARIVRRGNRVIISNVDVVPRVGEQYVIAQGRGVYNVARFDP